MEEFRQCQKCIFIYKHTIFNNIIISFFISFKLYLFWHFHLCTHRSQKQYFCFVDLQHCFDFIHYSFWEGEWIRFNFRNFIRRGPAWCGVCYMQFTSMLCLMVHTLYQCEGRPRCLRHIHCNEGLCYDFNFIPINKIHFQYNSLKMLLKKVKFAHWNFQE